MVSALGQLCSVEGHRRHAARWIALLRFEQKVVGDRRRNRTALAAGGAAVLDDDRADITRRRNGCECDEQRVVAILPRYLGAGDDAAIPDLPRDVVDLRR